MRHRTVRQACRMAGDRVEIIRSSQTFNTVSARDRDYFEILRSS